MPQHRQPFLHDLVTVLAAPTQVLSAGSGDVLSSPEDPGAQGILHADVRVVSDLRLTVDGHPPEHIATSSSPVDGPGFVRFTAVLRRLATPLPEAADPVLRLDRQRRVRPGRVSEEVVIGSLLDRALALRVEVSLGSDFASVEQIKVGAGARRAELDLTHEGDGLRWSSGAITVTLHAPEAVVDPSTDGRTITLGWAVTVPAHGARRLGWALDVTDPGGVVIPATPARPVAALAAEAGQRVRGQGVVEPRLLPWLERSLADLDGLRMATADHPGDTFFAAGAPWYLTLFGRDSLWAARMLLPLDLEPAVGTLRTLARLQGTVVDPASAQSPGKIMHELRRGRFSFGRTSLPPLYYGTVDATPLWICLLADTRRAGLGDDVLRELAPALQAALTWLPTYGDADGDGILEYVDDTGRGLANQGWKDSADAVRFADGSLARGPVALCEVQGYAYEAAMAGADLLDELGAAGADRHRRWAAELARRFRDQFWCGTGDDRYPALALDGQKRRVDSLTSNIGHLLGTGLLDADEELLVARRVSSADLDSGLGLRTMSAHDGGYSPLSYHCGSVWPHDTAIVIAGLVRASLGDHAAGLVEGLLRASVAFDQRLPELWSGEGRPVPYPAACRPQAWSAAAAVVVATALAAPALREPSAPIG